MSSELSMAEALLERPQRRESGTVESGLRVLRASNMMLITKKAAQHPQDNTREPKDPFFRHSRITCSHHTIIREVFGLAMTIYNTAKLLCTHH